MRVLPTQSTSGTSSARLSPRTSAIWVASAWAWLNVGSTAREGPDHGIVGLHRGRGTQIGVGRAGGERGRARRVDLANDVRGGAAAALPFVRQRGSVQADPEKPRLARVGQRKRSLDEAPLDD